MSNEKIIIVSGFVSAYSDGIEPLKDDDEPRR